MNNYKESDYIIESFDEFMEKKFSNNSFTERYKGIGKYLKLPKNTNLNKNISYFCENNSEIEMDKFNFNDFLEENFSNNAIIPVTEGYKPKFMTYEEDLDEGYDYEAIAIGVSIIDSQINENNYEYDFLYNCLDENSIRRCHSITNNFLKENYLTEDDINYCILSLYTFLVENELFKEPQIADNVKNKKHVANNQEVARIYQKKIDWMNNTEKRYKEKMKLAAQKRAATIVRNKNLPRLPFKGNK